MTWTWIKVTRLDLELTLSYPKYQSIIDGLEHSKVLCSPTEIDTRKKPRAASLPTPDQIVSFLERSSKTIKIMGTKEESELFLTNKRLQKTAKNHRKSAKNTG